nr:uncharacterized protein LOC110365830 isoform X1 [Columba livia]
MFLELLLVQAPRAHLVTTGLASPTASSDTSPNRNCGVKKSKHTENNSTIKETDLFKVITCFTLVLSLSKARLIPSRRAGLKATLQVLTDPSPNRGHPRRSWEKREDDGKLLTVLVMTLPFLIHAKYPTPCNIPGSGSCHTRDFLSGTPTQDGFGDRFIYLCITLTQSLQLPERNQEEVSDHMWLESADNPSLRNEQKLDETRRCHSGSG